MNIHNSEKVELRINNIFPRAQRRVSTQYTHTGPYQVHYMLYKLYISRSKPKKVEIVSQNIAVDNTHNRIAIVRIENSEKICFRFTLNDVQIVVDLQSPIQPNNQYLMKLIYFHLNFVTHLLNV